MQHRYEHRLFEEAEAGRKFLQELRKPHDNDVELDEAFNLDMTADYHVDGKEKKVSLRSSLERLIEEYLRKITAESEEFEIESRQRRHSHNITIIDVLPTNDTARGTAPILHETIFEDDDYDQSGDDNQGYDDEEDVAQSGSGAHITANSNDDVGVVISSASADDDVDDIVGREMGAENSVERIELGSQKINASSAAASGDHEQYREGKQKAKGRKETAASACFANRRRISHLDKIELESSLKNLTVKEFNIRNLLNYR